jgi:hypothetical protein
MFWSEDVRRELIEDRRDSLQAAARHERAAAGTAKEHVPSMLSALIGVRALRGRLRLGRKAGLGTSA